MASDTTGRWFALLGVVVLLAALFAMAAPASATEESMVGDVAEQPPPAPEDPPTEDDPRATDPDSGDPTDPTTDPTGDDAGDEAPRADEPDIAEPPVFDPTDPEQILRDIVFPVVGPTWWGEGFGDCRDGCTRLHEGIDIMTYGWKGVPVVAAHDGVVVWTSIGQSLSGCGVVIRAPDEWTTVYTHLNTDTPGTDDDAFPCLAPGIEMGASVRAGTLLGWVGDAGNAEETPPHLHFEIRHPEHGAVDPAVSLYAAARIEHHWLDVADLADVAAAMHPDATSLYVVPVEELDAVAVAVDEIEGLDIPLVVFDAVDPVPAWKAMEEIGPERIVVLTRDPTAAFIHDLLSVASIVEVVALPETTGKPEAPVEPADGGSDAGGEANAEPADPIHGAIDPPDRIIGFEPVDSATTIVIAHSRRISSGTLRSLGDHPVIVLLGDRPPADPGTTSDATPGTEANRNGLWWPTADGWRLTDDVDDAPVESIGYVAGRDIRPWTLAYLSSRATAPPMPWWHHQPTSLPTKSL